MGNIINHAPNMERMVRQRGSIDRADADSSSQLRDVL